MVKIAIEIISLLLFLGFFGWLMYIIIRGIWNSFGNKKTDEYSELLSKYNYLKADYDNLKEENQKWIDRVTYLEDKLESISKKEKSTKKSKVTKKHG